MKKFKSVKDIHMGKKGRITCAVVLTLTVCAAAASQISPELLATLTGNEIPLHDGDVLVDSLNISKDETEPEKMKPKALLRMMGWRTISIKLLPKKEPILPLTETK